MCFDSLARTNTLMARVWIELCSKCAEMGGYVFVQETMTPEIMPAFRSLEILRYISSCEIDNVVSIRANGHIIIEEDGELIDSYCINPAHIEQIKSESS